MNAFQPQTGDTPPTGDANLFESDAPATVNAPKFYSLSAIITFFLLPPFWMLSIHAIVFSKEAKAMYEKGNIDLYKRFSFRAKKFVVSAWAIFLILAFTAVALLVTIHLSLI